MFIENAYAESDTITVQDTEAAPKAPPSMMESGWASMMPMILIFAVFYFLLIRPQEKRRRQQESLVAGVKIGEEVLTNSGIYGTVTKINDSDNTVYVQVAKDVEIKFLKNSIADVISRSKKEVPNDPKKALPKKSKKK
jgi:preprotein translocase subunit YajC